MSGAAREVSGKAFTERKTEGQKERRRDGRKKRNSNNTTMQQIGSVQ